MAAKTPNRRGNNLIEFSFLVPWYIFLFVGTFDYGFFAYSLISTQSAARTGAYYCATNSSTQSDSTTACGYALDQLRSLPNVGSGVTTCGGSSPVTVTATATASGPDGNPATTVSVTYTSPQLIPIPGIFPGQITITRTLQMRLRG